MPQARYKARPTTRSAWRYWMIFWSRVGRLVAAPRMGRPTAYADWGAHLAQRTAVSGPRRSLHQFERRVKRWAGLPLRWVAT